MFSSWFTVFFLIEESSDVYLSLLKAISTIELFFNTGTELVLCIGLHMS
jgi:hypothetical protein